MSAVNVILQPDAGYLYSDAGLYGPRGELVIVCSKLITLPASRCAIGLRGTGCLPWMVVRELGDCDGLEAVLDGLPEYLRQIRDMLSGGIDPTYDQRVNKSEMTVVGWSEARGIPTFWTISSLDSEHPDEDGPLKGRNLPAFTLAETGICSFSPAFSQSPMDFLGKRLESRDDVFALDPETDGLKIMQAQRETLVDVPGIGPISTVGGFCEMARVTADGVSSKILHTWPDQTGKPITALAAPPFIKSRSTTPQV